MTWARAEWDRVLAVGLILLGIVLLALGYHGVSRTPYVAEQLNYIVSGGLGGLFSLGIGATLLISADLHDEWRKLDRLEAAVRGEPAPLPAAGRSEDNGHSVRRPTSGVRSAELVSASAVALPLASVVRRSYTLVAAGLLAAATLFALGWNRTSGEADPKTALEGLVVAIGGIVVVGVATAAGTMWLKRTVRMRQTRIMAPWLLSEMTRQVSEDLPARRNGAAADDDGIWVAPGLTRYHRGDCRALVGVAARRVDRTKVAPKLTACRLCEPD